MSAATASPMDITPPQGVKQPQPALSPLTIALQRNSFMDTEMEVSTPPSNNASLMAQAMCFAPRRGRTRTGESSPLPRSPMTPSPLAQACK